MTMPNKRYRLERFEVESLRDIESLVANKKVPKDELHDCLKFLDGLYSKLDSIRTAEEREHVDATNIRRVMNWISNLKMELTRCDVVDGFEESESEKVFFVPLTSFGCAK
jgi:hypothetical protein